MEFINGLTPKQHEELSKPLDLRSIREHTRTRKDNQRNLRHEYVRLRLNEIFGHTGWSEQNLELVEIEKCVDKEGWWTYAYRARQRLIIHRPDGDRTYDGAGAWGTRASFVNKLEKWEVCSDAMNGAQSIALCRATKSLGTQFGLALYADDPEAFPARHSLPYEEYLHQHSDNIEQPELPEEDDT
jgi:hypothetical protein